jgi:hypothetical protein
MENFRLISMTDFVLEQKETSTYECPLHEWLHLESGKLTKIRNYANFLKQPLELWMFVPCDENGKPMKEGYEVFDEDCTEYDEYVFKYQKAKERCLFEGFKINCPKDTVEFTKSITDESGYLHIAWFSKITCSWHFSKTLKFIESIGYGFTLTQTAINQITK